MIKERCIDGLRISLRRDWRKTASTKENKLIIVIKKAISDLPFNSVSELLSGRLHVCTARATFPFTRDPVSLGNKRNVSPLLPSCYESFKEHRDVWGVVLQGLSGIKFCLRLSPPPPLTYSLSSSSPLSRHLVLPPARWSALKTSSGHKLKQTHN